MCYVHQFHKTFFGKLVCLCVVVSILQSATCTVNSSGWMLT